MTELKDTKDKWLIDIFEPLDKIEWGEIKATQLIALILTMAIDSVQRIKEKITASSEELTKETQEQITEAYVNMLAESSKTVLCHYAKDNTKAPYSLSAEEINKLNKYFMNILVSKFSNPLLSELFVNNFIISSFNGILRALEHKSYVTKEKQN